jgi:hypothetical protein
LPGLRLVGCAVGDPAALFGADQFYAGARKAWTGREVDGYLNKSGRRTSYFIGNRARDGISLTWNFRHINNAEIKTRIRTIIGTSGYESPVICSPEELARIIHGKPAIEA